MAGTLLRTKGWTQGVKWSAHAGAPSARDAELEGAILDVNLVEETSLAVANILEARGVPFALATGCAAAHLPAGFQQKVHLEKPYSQAMVERFLESIGLARRIVAACGRDLRSLMGDEARLKALDPAAFVDKAFGLPTVRDILAELAKPGRDPRPAFVTATFAEGVNEIGDFEPGMALEGTVTNVAAFGAFVD